jgi:hypothetical protein
MRWWRVAAAGLGTAWFLAVGFGGCTASGDTEGETGCTIGSERCECTRGGACDPGLECLSGICVDPDGGGNGGGGTGGTGTGTGQGGTGNDDCVPGEGCQAIDVIFALDSSASMTEEINALASTSAFTGVAQALAAVNCGQIDYRVGVTNDNDGGFFVPAGWSGANPWFDSLEMSDSDIATAVNGAAQAVASSGGASLGCEHVLTSATHLVTKDATGFVREGALLVFVLMSDVDDYGAYDHQPPADFCHPCTEPVTPVATLFDSLVALKDGDPAAVATIILAGDPGVSAGANFCGAPTSCCAGGDCDSFGTFHASRLWEFATATGQNGVTHDICQGPSSLPIAVNQALGSQIDIACQELMPPE